MVKKTSHNPYGKTASTDDDNDVEAVGGVTVDEIDIESFDSNEFCSFSSYNGPYTESSSDDLKGSIRKGHVVHWPDTYSEKHEQSVSQGNILQTTTLAESPSAHRRPLNSSLSHFIQTAIIPAGSTVSNVGTNQFVTSSKELTSSSIGYNSVM